MKQIVKTPQILASLKQAVGADVNLDDLAVYEAIALNTLPIRQRHPLFKGAIHSESFLHQMAAQLRQESLPLHIMHEGWNLPLGRVFDAKVVPGNQGTELRSLFFIAKSGERGQEAINLIESGTVDQVSVGHLSKNAICSECGFDFLGSEATLDHVWSGTCANGHTMGEQGAHVELHSLDQWFELSLVNMGGAQNARIQSQSTSRFSQEQLTRLAASGSHAMALFLNASPTEKIEVSAPDFTKLTDDLVAAKVEVGTLTANVTALTAERDSFKTQLETLKASQSTSDADKDAKITALTASLGEALVALKDIAKQVLILKGTPDAAIPEEIPAVITLINESKETLVKALKAGGVALSAESKTLGHVALGAFKSAR